MNDVDEARGVYVIEESKWIAKSSSPTRANAPARPVQYGLTGADDEPTPPPSAPFSK